jgi:hypothetical protein
VIESANLSEVPQRNAGAPPWLRAVGRAAMVGALSGAAWVALALRRPEVTYHLAPLIVAGSAPVTARHEARRPRGRVPLIAGTASTLLALAITVALAVTDHLEGPTLWHTRPAALEAVLAALAGGVCGTWVAMRWRTDRIVR